MMRPPPPSPSMFHEMDFLQSCLNFTERIEEEPHGPLMPFLCSPCCPVPSIHWPLWTPWNGEAALSLTTAPQPVALAASKEGASSPLLQQKSGSETLHHNSKSPFSLHSFTGPLPFCRTTSRKSQLSHGRGLRSPGSGFLSEEGVHEWVQDRTRENRHRNGKS